MRRSRRFKAAITKAESPASVAEPATASPDNDFQDVIVKLRVRGDTRKAMATMGDGLRPVLGSAIVKAIQKATTPANPGPVVPAPATQTLKFARVIVSKAETAEEERYVLGVVMEPDEIDTQGHTETAETIRKAQQAWMEAYRTGGEAGHFTVQHARTKDGKVVDSDHKFAVLECYIQKSDETYEGQALKKGSWMMAERVLDDEMWSAIKKGEITGFSIGGTAVVNSLV